MYVLCGADTDNTRVCTGGTKIKKTTRLFNEPKHGPKEDTAEVQQAHGLAPDIVSHQRNTH